MMPLAPLRTVRSPILQKLDRLPMLAQCKCDLAGFNQAQATCRLLAEVVVRFCPRVLEKSLNL